MIGTLIVSGITCFLIILEVLIKPTIRIKNKDISLYWITALLGAVILLCARFVDIKSFFSAITANNAVNPLKILALFLSMTIMSVFLDEAGLFKHLASTVLKRSKSSQTKMFFALYFVVAFLTVFTSNDIIVLTFTPFLCAFCKNARINPLPYLFCEFVAANTWSMTLIIGNPTNIYLATSVGIPFLEYFEHMIIPTTFSGITSLTVLFILFRKKLKDPINSDVDDVDINDKPVVIIGLVHLVLCTIMLAISSYIGLEMWYISVGFLCSMITCILVYRLIKKEKPTILITSFKRAPWELVPFVLSMFVIVLALDECGFSQKLVKLLGNNEVILTYGLSSALFANLVNNIPMSVLYGNMLSYLSNDLLMSASYASIVGSNIGAFMTPIGALAGIMWSNILKKNEVEFSFLTFIKYGLVIAIPTLFATLGGLYISALF